MEFLFNLLVFLHFVGLAAALGGFLAQIRSADKGVSTIMLHGVLTQWVTGVAMFVLLATDAAEPGEFPDVQRKLEVKLLVATVIAVVALLGRRKKVTNGTAFWVTIGVLEIVNVAIAVFWTAG
jgi:hypothetical protein